MNIYFKGSHEFFRETWEEETLDMSVEVSEVCRVYSEIKQMYYKSSEVRNCSGNIFISLNLFLNICIFFLFCIRLPSSDTQKVSPTRRKASSQT